jgi:hypothetical protein
MHEERRKKQKYCEFSENKDLDIGKLKDQK